MELIPHQKPLKGEKRDNPGPEISPPLALGVGLATLAIALPFGAVGIGLIEAEEPIHWLLRVVLVLFVTPFALIGAALAGGGFMLLVEGAVPGEASFALRAPRYVFGQIARPRHLAAALPAALVLAQYWAVSRSGVGFFGVGAALLERGIVLEFIAIHATAVLGLVTFIPRQGRLRFARMGVFTALSALYLAMASTAGWETALFLAYLVGMKIGPFLLDPPDLLTGASLGLRWGFQTIVFLSVFSFFGGFDSLTAGAVYWTTVTAAELLGMNDADLLA